MMVSVRFTIRHEVDDQLTTDFVINASYASIGYGDWMLRHAEIDHVVAWIKKQGHVGQVCSIDVTHWIESMGLHQATIYGKETVMVAAENPDEKDRNVRLIDLILAAAEDEAEYRERRRAAAEHVAPDAEDLDYERIRNGDVPTPLRMTPEWNK